MRTPNGIRTRVAAVKGRCPRPLDDGGQNHSSGSCDLPEHGAFPADHSLSWTYKTRGAPSRFHKITARHAGPGRSPTQAPCRYDRGVPFEITRREFEEAVDDAIDRIPDDLAQAMDNVAIFVVEEYEPGPGEAPDTELLGLYEGTPLTERDGWWEAGSLPDRISIFRQPLMRLCTSREELVEEILVTVVHEVAHHFGIDDARLHELGWG